MIRSIGTALFIIAMIAAALGAADDSRGKGPDGAYNMEQTLSDQAQQATIAFDALAFLTGDACSDTFLPPGKVADYAGF